ncbi:hypothetical protein F652_592 [Enterobacteriaceae bacterium bta3-1]|nr:hypothetical protein F652_592 [Enterobacteriaceae bacterium bta3-1]
MLAADYFLALAIHYCALFNPYSLYNFLTVYELKQLFIFYIQA